MFHPKRDGAVLGGILVFGLILAWHNRFLMDDAFISFRYAANLAAGHGLVFNVGERVEGYTNFSWTVLLAAAIRLGLAPEAASQWLGLAASGVTLALVHVTARSLLKSSSAAALVAVVLATNYSFSAFATGGLETALQAALFAGLLFLVAGDERWSDRRLLALSLWSAVAILTRPDSVLVVGLAWLFVVAQVWRGRAGEPLRCLVIAVVPVVAIVGPWVYWKLGFYGHLLPNTYFAKVPVAGSMERGFAYLDAFVSAYRFGPFLVLTLAAMPALLRRRPAGFGFALALVSAWAGYVVAVGGDFMEFRLLVPILPALALVSVAAVRELVPMTAAQWALLALLPLASFGHARHFRGTGDPLDLQSVAGLADHLTDPASDWIGVGKALERELGSVPGVSIALAPAGAIPYYSGLESIDMFGLTDAWVGRHAPRRPGSGWPTRIAPLAYLARRGVTLVIGHPWLVDAGARLEASAPVALRQLEVVGALPSGSYLVRIPMGDGRELVALVLTRSAELEAAIAARAWAVQALATPVAESVSPSLSDSAARVNVGFALELDGKTDADSTNRLSTP